MTKRKLEQIARLIGEVPPDQVKALLRKDQGIRVRLSQADKTSIEAAAARRGLSVSAYLLQLHRDAEGRP